MMLLDMVLDVCCPTLADAGRKKWGWVLKPFLWFAAAVIFVVRPGLARRLRANAIARAQNQPARKSSDDLYPLW